MTKMSQNDFEDRFAALNDLIQQAETALIQGKVVRFHDLESNMNDLCTAAENAAPEIAASLREPMAEMISRLDALALKLEEFKNLKQQEQNGA